MEVFVSGVGARASSMTSVSAIALSMIVVVACAGDPTTPDEAELGGATRPVLQQNWGGGGSILCAAQSIAIYLDESVVNPGNQTGAYFNEPYGGAHSWGSSDSSVAIPVMDSRVPYRATVTAYRPGIVCISAKVSTFDPPTEYNGAIRLAVPGVRVEPGSVAITAGATRQLDVMAAIGEDGNPMPSGTIEWWSDNTAVATVSNAGLVTAAGSGTATIRARVGGFTGQTALVPVTIKPTVTISGPSSLVNGAGGTYTANTVGCVPACTYEWIAKYIDPFDGEATELDLGDQRTTYIRPQGSLGRRFDVIVTITSGSMTAWDSHTVLDYTRYP